LFDTGALSGSYIAESFVKKHFNILKPYLVPYNGKVMLADNKTELKINYLVRLDMVFIGKDGVEHRGNIPFNVFPTSSNNEMIIGLPAIIEHFSVLHKQMIDHAVEEMIHSSSVSSIIELPQEVKTDTMFPWSNVEGDAPEDLEIELPCSFTDALHYIELSVEEAEQEFFNLIPTHVSEEFRKATDIENLLKTKGVRVFVPHNWEGINGLPPLELKFKEGMPSCKTNPTQAIRTCLQRI